MGARSLGLHPVGLEIDPHAVATRYAAGHATWVQSVPDVTYQQLARLAGHVDGIIASPPCQDFSAAGKKAGIDGDRGELMWQVPRWVEALRPRWIACEQVPPALPWFELFAHDFRALDYSTWTGVLNAADYGVPQTRKRAFLLASLDRAVQPPEPTHAEGGEAAGMFTPELAPWVTMAEALGWGEHVEVSHIRGAGMAERHGDRPPRRGDQPAPTIDGGAQRRLNITGVDRRQQSDGVPKRVVPLTEPAPTLDGQVSGKWVLNPGRTESQPNRRTYSPDEPAPTVAFGHDAAGWAWERPATTIVGSFSPDTVAAPGYRKPGDPPRQDTPGSVKITPAEAATLQGFPHNYPWQGPKTAVFQQIGNAVPPPVAAAALQAIT